LEPRAANSNGFPATGEVKDENDEGDHEQEMDESAGDVKRKSGTPEQQQKNGNEEEHARDSDFAGIPAVHPRAKIERRIARQRAVSHFRPSSRAASAYGPRPMFTLLGNDPSSKARRGRLVTTHGVVEMPQFMPVGTQGSVKAVSPDELTQLGAQIILGNTYHLFVRPGMEVMRKFGGLHRFMGWNGPILTDSGGFQVFSLAKLRKITPEGVHFQNHLDGSPMFLGPREAMEIQAVLGSDICMLFDECPPHPCERDYAAKSLALTLKWAAMCKDVETPGMKFGIVQGSSYADLRRESAEALDKHKTSYTMLRKLNTKHAGFTLVEIMIVVAIIALLAAIAVPNFLRSRKRSQATQVLEDLRIIDSATDQYAIETNKTSTAAVAWTDVQNYIKTGTRLCRAIQSAAMKHA
jgi:prepilin-type N-terminal cleavage/methylation domain-containing protein